MFRGIFSDRYHRVVQIHAMGRTDGYFYVEFSRDENGTKFEVLPFEYAGADAYITASFDHLLGMADGSVSFDKLFLSGQIKVDGNLAKGAQVRNLLCKKK